MKGGVRKKEPSETYWKIDVLLLTFDDLGPLRVQNENMPERQNPIFRKRAGSPACGGGVHEEEEPRAARRKISFCSVFDAELDAEDAQRRPQAKKLPNTPEVRVAFIDSIQSCTLCRNIFAVLFQSINDRKLQAASLLCFVPFC